MGFFNKIKDAFKKEEKDIVTEKYEVGLSKSREEFVSKLSDLTETHKKIDEDYFEAF